MRQCNKRLLPPCKCGNRMHKNAANATEFVLSHLQRFRAAFCRINSVVVAVAAFCRICSFLSYLQPFVAFAAFCRICMVRDAWEKGWKLEDSGVGEKIA